MEVAVEMNTRHIDSRLDGIAFKHRLRARQFESGPNFFRGAVTVQPHRTLRVVPFSKDIELALNPVHLSGEERQVLPELEGLEKPLDP